MTVSPDVQAERARCRELCLDAQRLNKCASEQTSDRVAARQYLFAATVLRALADKIGGAAVPT